MLAKLNTTLDDWFLRNATIVVAVSGGADSVALLSALGGTLPSDHLVAAHVNHRLRGTESDQDASFVADLAGSLGVHFEVVSAPPPPELIRARGVEAAARIVRYEALHAVLSSHSPGVIATAHTADDQAETVLLRLATNAAIESLAGITPRTALLVRPMLSIRRSDVRQYLTGRGIEWRTDSTNSDDRFARNQIRLHLLPELEKRDPEVVDRLSRIADHVREITDRITPARGRLEALWKRGNDQSVLPASALPADPDLRRLMLLDEISRLIPGGREVAGARLSRLVEELSQSPSISLGDGLTASLSTGTLRICRDSFEPPAAFEVTLPCDGDVQIPEIGATVSLRAVSDPAVLSSELTQTFGLPPDLERPLRFIVRSRRPGDRFHPLGLDGTKKLKDFLIDRKVPASDRDRLPLLVLGDEIVWVPGAEVSERFRVAPGRDLYRVQIDYDDSAIPENA